METVSGMRQVTPCGFDVKMGAAALRNGRYWVGQCAGNWILWPLRRRKTAARAIADAEALLRAVSASESTDG